LGKDFHQEKLLKPESKNAMINRVLNNKIKSTYIFSFLIYILLNSFVLFQREQSKNGLEKFDLDRNGFVDNNEITAEYHLEIKKVSSDTGMNLAPITLIPISLFFGLIFFLLIKFVPKRFFRIEKFKLKRQILDFDN
jgi:hypothetical protein